MVSGKHSIYTHFPKDRDCDVCLKTKITRLLAEKSTGAAIARAENFAYLITADHKVPSEGCESRNNHRYAVVVQDLATQWIQSFPLKTQTSQQTEKSLQKFFEPTWKSKVIYTVLRIGKACGDLSWKHFVRQHLTVQRQVVLLKKLHAECRKGLLQNCCKLVSMKNGGQILWSVTAICDTFKIS